MSRKSRLSGLGVFLFPAALCAQPADLLIADFEAANYGGWTVTGTAFGTAPARGTLPNQQTVSGYMGGGLVNTFLGGDAPTGTLRSPNFTLQRDYINFLVAGGSHPTDTFIELIVNGQVVYTVAGNETESLFWTTWKVSQWAGQTASIRIVDNATGGWGHILVDQIQQSATARAYRENYRPQFHFSAHKSWLNDPNGLVYYGGEYHLFYQNNPYGIQWGNMTWGHAVSPDLIHWEHLPLAITPDNASCTAYSGSAVVDWNNTSGFQTGTEKVMVAIWTSFGCGQSIAYSNDKGRTWTKYSGNPVIPMEGEMRDPKVFWHAPTARWVMAIWTDTRGNGVVFYTSPNLRTWTYRSIITGFFECPDIFELPVDGGATRKWVLHAADGRYQIGTFDGTQFVRETGPFTLDWGAHWYASQSYSDIPTADGRRINISWMRNATYPGMPFNQQMSLPTVFSLRTLPAGVRLTKVPVRELDVLRLQSDTLRNVLILPGQNLLSGRTGELFDLVGEFELAGATEFGFRIRGTPVTYNVAAGTLSVLGTSAPLPASANRVRIRVVVDRSTLEVFGNDGAVSLTNGFLPPAGNTSLETYAVGGNARAISLEIHPLRGSWDPRDLADAWTRAQNPTPIQAKVRPMGRTIKVPGMAFNVLGRYVQGGRRLP